jgi:hypothetical protein
MKSDTQLILDSFQNNFNSLEKRINEAKAVAQIEIDKRTNEAKQAFSEYMQLEPIKTKVNLMVSQVETSKELTQVENDEWLHQWIRADFSDLGLMTDFLKGLFAEYMQENHYVSVDFKNSVLTYSVGPALIINDQGDVYDQDSGQWPIKRTDYETKAELNSLIEAHMEKTGHFPSVIRMDRHGNAYYVNTQEKAS